MEKMNDKLSLINVLTEIRFPPSPLFSDLKLLSGYVNFLNLRFDSVRYEEQSKQIKCDASEERKQASIFNNRIAIEFSAPAGHDGFISFCESIIIEYTEKFEVNKFDRTGIRYNMLMRYNTIEEAKKLFFDKFLYTLRNVQIPVDLSSGLNSGKVDLYYTIEDKKLYISILPMKMQSLEIKVGPIGQEDAIQNTIDGIMFDMDYFQEGKVSLVQFKNQLKMGAGIVKTKATNLVKALGI